MSLSSPQLNINIRRIGTDRVVVDDDECDDKEEDKDDINGNEDDEDDEDDIDDVCLVPEDSENHKAASIVLK